MTWQLIHEKAVRAAKACAKSDQDLLEVLELADAERIYRHFNLTSTYQYCTEVLKLSEGQAYMFIRVARKASEIPELKEAIEQGKLSVSKAKKIASVVTTANQSEWIGKAQSLPTRELELEVVKADPKELVPDRVRPIAEKLYGLHCTVDGETESLLKKAQDILSGKSKSSAAVGDVLKVALLEFVQRNGRLERSERNAPQSAPDPQPALRYGKRLPVAAAIAHSVRVRDEGRCTFVHPVSGRCKQTRWTQQHHIREVWDGGKHSVSNLTTLCSEHHRQVHRPDSDRFSRRTVPGT